MEIVKNISAILGLVLTAASVLALLSKTVRSLIVGVFEKYGKSDEVKNRVEEIKNLIEQHIEDESIEVKNSVEDIKKLLEQHIEEEKTFREDLVCMNEINLEFTRTQCRNIIKNIFYHYNDTKILPLYEKKTLICVEDLYTNRLHGNSFASLLLEEMHSWDVDFDHAHEAERE